MAVSVCWSVKGGSGTSVVAACLALCSRSDTVLVDVDGELPAVLGLPEPDGQGLTDWFASDAPAPSVIDLAVAVNPTTRLVARGDGRIDPESPRWEELRSWLAIAPTEFVVDAGCGEPPAGLVRHTAPGEPLRLSNERAPQVRSLLVTRACYLALRRATRLRVRPDGVIIVDEDGRSLKPADVASSVGAPVVTTVPVDPALARAVDAGLLAARLPRSIEKAFRAAVPERSAAA